MAPPAEPSGEQTHPLYGRDRSIVDGLLAATVPSNDQLVEAGRLWIRYDGFPGALDLQRDLEKLLRLWGLSREQLNDRCRQLWAGGFRPGQGTGQATAQVGSGFDSADSEN
jgi:hypothetical protein